MRITILIRRAGTFCIDTMKVYGPGLALLLAIALTARLTAGFLPSFLGEVFVAVILGIIIANTLRPAKRIFGQGVKLGLSKILKIAIILLGFGFNLREISRIGLSGILIVLILIGFVFLATFVIGRQLNVGLRKKLLIAVGVSICGNTAIVASAPLVRAEEEEVAMAVGIVTLFGVVGVLLYPLLGMAFGMSDTLFGAWAGTAINDTSQVVAAGFMFSDAAGKVATTVKLVRNIMIVPVVVLVGYFYRKTHNGGTGSTGKINLVQLFPIFVLGFLGTALLASFVAIPARLASSFGWLAKFLILLALSGIGLGVEFKKFRAIGAKPFILGFSVEVLLAIVSISLHTCMHSQRLLSTG